MKNTDLEKRKSLILAHETEISRQLALHVLEKPRPMVWMIFIPVLFVFYFWKLKEYESSLKDFAENSLIPWRRTLEAVFAAEETGSPVNDQLLVDQFVMKREATRPLCGEWFTVLTEHFRLLLNAEGDSYPELVRSGYRNRSNYLQFCHQIGKTETAYNMALLDTIDGDSADLCQVTQTMAEGIRNLRLQSAEICFPEPEATP